MARYITIGRVGAPYGVQGWLKIHSLTEKTADILKYNPWYLAQGEHWEAVEVEEGRPQGKTIVVKFRGIEAPEIARKLTSRIIGIQREQLAPLPPNEYYWADLEGLKVINQHGQTLGQVHYLMATGANDVVVIQDSAGKEHALPYLLGSVIKQIDIEKQIIQVDWELI